MLATCDSQYNFTTATVGSGGSENDAGIFQRSKLGKKLGQNIVPNNLTQRCLFSCRMTLDLPPPEVINGTGLMMPYVFVGDEAFPLLKDLMCPFPREGMTAQRRLYNYRWHANSNSEHPC